MAVAQMQPKKKVEWDKVNNSGNLHDKKKKKAFAILRYMHQNSSIALHL